MIDIASALPCPDARESREVPPWIWPLPRLNGLLPGIVDACPSHPERRDVALGYDQHAPLPRFIPVFAARAGTIRYAGMTVNGYVVCLGHPGGSGTQYAGFEHLFATPSRRGCPIPRVRAGDILGYLGNASPRVRFELATFSEEDAYEPIDPSERMSRWSVLPWTDTPRPPSTQANPNHNAA